MKSQDYIVICTMYRDFVYEDGSPKCYCGGAKYVPELNVHRCTCDGVFRDYGNMKCGAAEKMKLQMEIGEEI